VAIENGHVSGRKVGDGASYVVIDQMTAQDMQPKDHLSYLTKTPDGKILKSSSMYIRNSKGKVSAILSINYDVSKLLMVENAVNELISTGESQQTEPEKIVNVNDLLDDLIEQSVTLVGKPVALMNKDDKVKAIRFLNQNGAFLVTKSGDKVARYFGISKYTLYSYIDSKQDNKQEGK
jgi:predicted transcriptional regulator YheO